MEKILQFIAGKTYGKSYRTSKLELEIENPAAQIEYDAPTFDCEQKLYRYPNGFEEILRLNEHL